MESKESVEKPKSSAKRERPNTKDPLIPFGTVLDNRYKLMQIIGAGGYGQIFKASWDEKKIQVAVKIMKKNHEPQRLILEQHILKLLQNKKNFPYIFGSGNVDEEYMFICMELLGRSLSDLRKKSENRRFDPPTAIRIGMQVLDALKTLHNAEYVHRDIKPGNLCCGYAPPTFRTIYIVDFGLSRKYSDGGKLIQRKSAGFRGTLRYVSLNVHERKDQGPVDDLISLFYSIVEMSEGILPWTRLRDQEEIQKMKKQCSAANLCSQQPPELFSFYGYCYPFSGSNESTDLDYGQLMGCLKRCLPEDAPEAMSYEQLLSDQTETRRCSTEVDA